MNGGVLIRTEINPSVASGHAMRCLALGAALRSRGATPVHLVCEEDLIVATSARDLGIDYLRISDGQLPVDAADAEKVVSRKPDLVVVDSPKTTQIWIDRIAEQAVPLAYLAGAPGPKPLVGADLCIWPELCPDKTKHVGRIRCGLDLVLLGPDYWQAVPRKSDGTVRKVLITTGGADHYNLCSISLRALDTVFDERLEVSIAVGAFFDNVDAIEQAARESHHSVTLVERPNGLYALLSPADLAISGGGGTLYEMARLGVPGIGIAIWPIQATTVDTMAAKGTIAGISWQSEQDTGRELIDVLRSLKDRPQSLMRMSKLGPTVIDGQGALRIADELLQVMHKRPRRQTVDG